MAVTVTDNRTILYQDGLTNISGASTSDTSFFAEATGCAAEAYNSETGQIFWSGTTPNFTTTGNELIYVWSAVVATLNGFKEPTPADSSHAMYLSDGTNNLIIYQAGNDRDVFKHADGQVSFQCMLVDIDYLNTLNTNGDLAAISGSFAGFNSATTSMDVGAHYTTLSKALGGGNNCYMDIIRYGGADAGISVTGGLTGDRGTFSEIAVEDRSTLDGKAHGIIREYTGGAYGVQGTLKFGTTGTGDSWFEDSGVSVTYEDRYVADDKFKMVVEGNPTAGEETHFILRNSTIQSARPAVTMDFSSSGINTLTLNTVTFLNLRNPITFATADTAGHTVIGCTFTNCGIVNPGTVDLTGCSFNNATDALGALELDTAAQIDGSTNLSFDSDGTGHAIYITATGTYTFDGHSYTDYATTDGTTGNEVVYNNSGGAVTINVSGGDTPTIRNGAGASTTVNNNVNVSLTGLENNTEVRVYEVGTTNVVAGIEDVTTGTYTFSTQAGANVDIRVFNIDFQPADILQFVVPAGGTSLPIQQVFDRNYSNP